MTKEEAIKCYSKDFCQQNFEASKEPRSDKKDINL
jgi:hypothetical protein